MKPLRKCLSVRGLVSALAHPYSLVGGQWLPSKSIETDVRCWRPGVATDRSIADAKSSIWTSENLTAESLQALREKWEQFPQASRASRSLVPALAEDLRIQGISGQLSPRPFVLFDQSGLCWRTTPAFGTHSEKTAKLFGQDTWGPFSETWPVSGIMRNGRAYRLQTSWRRISAKECGFWPTATTETGGPNHKSKSVVRGKHGINLHGAVTKWQTATCSRHGGDIRNLIQRGGHYLRRSGQKAQIGLDQEVLVYPGKFRTALKSDADKGKGGFDCHGFQQLSAQVQPGRFVTATVMDAAGFCGQADKGRTSPNSGRTLNGEVLELAGRGPHVEPGSLPTAKARDYRTGDLPDSVRQRKKRSGETHSSDLNDVVAPGVLENPQWLDQFMGQPPGWTSKEPCDGVWHGWVLGRCEYQYEDEPPRVIEPFKGRRQRVEAGGDGQVWQSMALAMVILNEIRLRYRPA